MLAIEKKHFILLVINTLVIVFFTIQFIVDQNYEFLLYVVSVVIFASIITYTHRFVRYSMPLLCMLSLWIFVHLAWWALSHDGTIWYEKVLLPISDTYNLIRYDQVIHMFWFFTATILAYEILKKELKPGKISFWILILLMLAGCWFGAINEVLEFLVDQSVEISWVGWYINTSVDLVVNLIGSFLGVVFIKTYLEKKSV
jgi:hypothetical protein